MTAQATVPVRRAAAERAAEPPAATWSNCLVLGKEVALSGMTAHPAARERQLDTYRQTLEVLDKIRALLEAAGGGLHNVYKLVVYVTDIADKDEVGRARREVFRGAWPCSTLVAVSGLVFPELKVEIDAFARLDVDLRAAVQPATETQE